MSTPTCEIPLGHVDNPDSIDRIRRAYAHLHDGVTVDVGRWDGETLLPAPAERRAYRFAVRASGAQIELETGNLVRGGIGPAYGPGVHPCLAARHREDILPGDAFVADETLGPTRLTGAGVYFEVVTEVTDYPAPNVSLLRNLGDCPGGCAPYDEAFRRETLPPTPVAPGGPDNVGSNRVNEHTLDMRVDRTPPPSQHHHGTVEGPGGRVLNHTETAIVIPREAYGRPPFEGIGGSRAVIFRDPQEKGTADAFTVPLEPGSILVTPSTPDRLYGHRFENAFAMLVAVPGFVAPYELIP